MTTAFQDEYRSLLLLPAPRPDSVRKMLAVCHAYYRIYLRQRDHGLTRRIVARDAVVNLGVTVQQLKDGLRLGQSMVEWSP